MGDTSPRLKERQRPPSSPRAVRGRARRHRRAGCEPSPLPRRSQAPSARSGTTTSAPKCSSARRRRSTHHTHHDHAGRDHRDRRRVPGHHTVGPGWACVTRGGCMPSIDRILPLDAEYASLRFLGRSLRAARRLPRSNPALPTSAPALNLMQGFDFPTKPQHLPQGSTSRSRGGVLRSKGRLQWVEEGQWKTAGGEARDHREA